MKVWLNKLAKIISDISQPPLVLGLFLVYIIMHYAPNPETGWLWLGITLGLTGIIPTVYTFIAVKMGWIKDVVLSRRKDRIGPFLIASLGAIISLMILYKLDAPNEILVFLMAFILVMLVVLMITTFWKISIHATTITVVAVAANVLADSKYWYLFLLIPIVAWARVYRKKHTVAQVVAGALLNGLIVYATFKYFGF